MNLFVWRWNTCILLFMCMQHSIMHQVNEVSFPLMSGDAGAAAVFCTALWCIPEAAGGSHRDRSASTTNLLPANHLLPLFTSGILSRYVEAKQRYQCRQMEVLNTRFSDWSIKSVYHTDATNCIPGLLTATVSSEVFKAAQPALLYLVPFTLLPLLTMAYLKVLYHKPE